MSTLITSHADAIRKACKKDSPEAYINKLFGPIKDHMLRRSSIIPPSSPTDIASAQFAFQEYGSSLRPSYINDSIIWVCMGMPSLILPFTEMFRDILTPNSISSGAMYCCKSYPQICLNMIMICIDKLDDDSFARGFGLCFSENRLDFLKILIEKHGTADCNQALLRKVHGHPAFLQGLRDCCQQEEHSQPNYY